MTQIPAEDALLHDMTVWRRHLHAHPEFGFREHATAAFVARRLREFGIEDVVEGVGGTGVVATVRQGAGRGSIALRADMDALAIEETSSLTYRSRAAGFMHACGHDGHTAILLGTARVLAQAGGFNGTVRLIFQPAEEHGKGAQAMLDDGLAARFPFDEIYGIHNMPGLPVGVFATTPGPLMAAEDIFEIAVTGRGVHAARPHLGRDPIVAGAAIVTALQTIVSRSLDPASIGVVSVTEFITDGVRNVIPNLVKIRGDARSFRSEVSAAIEAAMRSIATNVAQAHGCSAAISYEREFIPLVNSPEPTDAALAAARRVFPDSAVDARHPPFTASEDFARLLNAAPGNFAFLGNGSDSAPLHNPAYDFNDEILIHGLRYFRELVRSRLPLRAT